MKSSVTNNDKQRNVPTAIGMPCEILSRYIGTGSDLSKKLINT
ncbi:hypothetical protein C8N25_120106 [Algoriphagus antarcticus]|uniref:Uncharacterized protein n=1 Tax=Algoriphagus antarcticus TaxID=238540 RepID=A0A3E0DJD4_9BACT|nr:hypothetical protein C8N25_120106 [Algoriphagus antarcticus]